MRNLNRKFIVVKKLLYIVPVLFALGCTKDKSTDPSSWVYAPTSYNLVLPSNFPAMPIPPSNPLTVEGVELGRHLFWDPKLSRDHTQACAHCHLPSAAFADTNQFSEGITGAFGDRQAMVLQNLGYANDYFWDGRAATLEDQIFGPVVNPVEMDNTWPQV